MVQTLKKYKNSYTYVFLSPYNLYVSWHEYVQQPIYCELSSESHNLKEHQHIVIFFFNDYYQTFEIKQDTNLSTHINVALFLHTVDIFALYCILGFIHTYKHKRTNSSSVHDKNVNRTYSS